MMDTLMAGACYEEVELEMDLGMWPAMWRGGRIQGKHREHFH